MKMNYQVIPLWIYSGLIAFFAVLAVVCGFYSMGAFMGYLLFTGIAWQVVVSLRLHRLKEKGLVSRSTDISHWLVYVNGIPVREDRIILNNPCFAVKQEVMPFFMQMFLLKSVYQCGFIVLLVIQFTDSGLPFVSLGAIAGLMAALIMLISFYRTLLQIRMLYKKACYTEQIQSTSGSLWYQLCFVTKKSEKESALGRLLAL